MKEGGREERSAVVRLIIRSRIQSLTALESEYNKSPEEDNGSDAGLVSRARMPLKLSPRKKGFTRIPPVYKDPPAGAGGCGYSLPAGAGKVRIFNRGL